MDVLGIHFARESYDVDKGVKNILTDNSDSGL